MFTELDFGVKKQGQNNTIFFFCCKRGEKMTSFALVSTPFCLLKDKMMSFYPLICFGEKKDEVRLKHAVYLMPSHSDSTL